MWLTTSKNAPKEVKKAALALADALPDATFMPRGETRLERLDERAKRAGEKTLLVVMVADAPSLFSLRSRHLAVEENGKEIWMWDSRMFEVRGIKSGARAADVLGEDAYVFVAAKKNDEEAAILAFLGLENHPLAEFSDEPIEVEVEAKKTKKKNENALKLSAAKQLLLSLEYCWVK